MKKLKEWLDIWFEGQKVKGVKTPTPAVIYELFDIAHGKQRETISQDVVSILSKCNIKTKTHGIGWLILAR